jgi:hypothetical protein
VAFDLKAYEGQAKLSIILALGGAVGAAGGIFLILQAFDWENFWLAYNPSGKRFLLIGATLALALVLAGSGFFVALNSAGQRRNKQSNLSWMGFVLNAVVLTMALSAGVFFAITRYPITSQT